MNVHSSGFALPRRDRAVCDDAWAVRERGDTLVAALADGVGTSREGGAAAHRAVEMVVDYCLARPRAWSPRRALAEFSSQINRHLHSESFDRYGQAELACTLTVVLIEGGRLYGCNVGDSPAFHWRRGRVQALSQAHAMTESGMDHVLTRAIGLEASVEPHFFETDLMEGDLLLLCSDGVTAALPPERIAELLSRRAAARAIVTTANAATEEHTERRDDVSAIVLDVIDPAAGTMVTRQRLELLRFLRPGDRIEPYALERALDRSERVWLASDRTATRVVLKFPSLEAAESEPRRDAFVREAWNASRLASPDLVRAWVPSGDTMSCYAMEFIDAPTLRDVLARGRLGVEETQALGDFLLRVGQFLLRHDLAHGDIKPDNILVIPSPDRPAFRLLDLGNAAEVFSVTSRAGTPSYLAPERFRGGAISERTEIFSMGVTLYEALTGTYPYGEVERFQTPRFESAPKRPGRLNPAVPAWLESIVLRAVEPDKARRYQHFSEMAYDLSHPLQVTPHHRKDAPLLERNPLLFYQVLCALLVTTVAALLIVLARRGE